MTAPALPRRRPRALRLGPLSIRIERRALLVGTVLGAAIAVMAVIALSTGAYQIPIMDVIRTLAGEGTTAQAFIVETLRLPRLLTGLLVGAALAVGGAMFQSVSRNPLGSPDIVGFDTGAATGALLVILLWHGTMAQVATGAVVGGVGTAIAVYLLAIKRGVSGYRLIIVGIGIAAMLMAVNDYLITRARITDAQTAVLWLTGSLNGRGWEQVRPVALALLVLAVPAIWLGRHLRMLELGDDTARALGIAAERTRLASVVVGVGLTAIATACTGPIAFVALAAPQVARRLTKVPGPNIVVSALTGALVLVVSDFAAQRLLGSTQLPVGVMTAAVGGVYLAWLLAAQWRKGRA
ncbi:iron complex transport system permease protein [Allocatelliglobosispora scoriae]|uniref:Iron complex transport system permease protein n=1 Tax=Allocatelliglobosispora scoriae TaxID=643052 RepID=A0A841C5S0_9ACTN|nr:iron chelate uptake ABC transporter family permease subunit [Allocatelliglobosispora scoriae]MBB5874151.1 iron complex transport system permease protein [Allocatelliglobosispora scoriae]